jgi:hypothetical protein
VDRMKNIQLQAMKAVVTPDDEALYRYVCRWFSSKFATPLMDVYDMPIDFVLQHYFEDMYENMSKEDRYTRTIELIESPAERQERLRKEAEEITQQVAQVRGIVKPEPKKLDEAVKDKPKSALEQQIQDIFGKLKKNIKMVPQNQPGVQEEFDEETRDALGLNSKLVPGDETGTDAIQTPPSPASVPNPESLEHPPEFDDLSFSFSEDDMGIGDEDPFSVPPPKPKPSK